MGQMPKPAVFPPQGPRQVLENFQSIGMIVMTSSPEESLAADAGALGAAFLRKPFFPPDVENALCGFYGLRAFSPRRI
jgi:hypothetical protein